MSYETLLNIADIQSRSTSTALDGWSLMVGGHGRDGVAHRGWTVGEATVNIAKELLLVFWQIIVFICCQHDISKTFLPHEYLFNDYFYIWGYKHLATIYVCVCVWLCYYIFGVFKTIWRSWESFCIKSEEIPAYKVPQNPYPIMFLAWPYRSRYSGSDMRHRIVILRVEGG